ncbi:hypothetical protein [Nonomuraea pusilla]|uniref:Protein CcmA, bactofilin family n=1 Tax=Nonomuraea pusilla TaxID=46177 RepID=A0A1H7ILM2_9ACTN|nr:hypothetical protein [Nonomuraea pusilla]SEK63298.1 hypothetical protein SAMN05660976_00851 [Nonomuraea pusilla]
MAGSLRFAQASLANPGRRALNASLDGGTLSNPGTTALSLRRLGVTGRLSCSEGFRADGEIVLINARIEGSLEFHGAALSNPGGRVLSLWEVIAGGGIGCCEGFAATGDVSISNSRIAATLCLAETTIDGDLHLRGVEAASLKIGPRTELLRAVDLRHSRVGVRR